MTPDWDDVLNVVGTLPALSEEQLADPAERAAWVERAEATARDLGSLAGLPVTDSADARHEIDHRRRQRGEGETA